MQKIEKMPYYLKILLGAFILGASLVFMGILANIKRWESENSLLIIGMIIELAAFIGIGYFFYKNHWKK